MCNPALALGGLQGAEAIGNYFIQDANARRQLRAQEANARRVQQDEAENVTRQTAALSRLDAEQALRGANAKFTRRFEAIEDALARQGRTPRDSDLQEMDALWNAAKAAEKG